MNIIVMGYTTCGSLLVWTNHDHPFSLPWAWVSLGMSLYLQGILALHGCTQERGSLGACLNQQGWGAVPPWQPEHGLFMMYEAWLCCNGSDYEVSYKINSRISSYEVCSDYLTIRFFITSTKKTLATVHHEYKMGVVLRKIQNILCVRYLSNVPYLQHFLLLWFSSHSSRPISSILMLHAVPELHI